jgi:hypothetical protein
MKGIDHNNVFEVEHVQSIPAVAAAVYTAAWDLGVIHSKW